MGRSNVSSVLDNCQMRTISAFRKKKCLAILGGAGTGKSFILSLIIQEARKQCEVEAGLAVCAMTNQASSNLGGTTIHSLLGAPPCWKFSNEALWNRVNQNKARRERLRAIEILIIDEVAVLTACILDAFDFVMRNLARSDRLSSIPFGGRQVIVAGDPFQLEPIGKVDGEEESLPAFLARSWFLMFGGFGSGVVSVLKGNHRQRNDSKFHRILNRVRVGKATPDDIACLNDTSKDTNGPPCGYTTLCLRRTEVDKVNQQALLSISGPNYFFEARDIYTHEKSEDLSRRLRATSPQLVQVKVGCHFLITRKLNGLLPGTRVVTEKISLKGSEITSIVVGVQGTFEGCSHSQEIYPMKFHVYAEDGSVAACRIQLPVISAYAITVHRSQGLTLPTVAMDFSCVRNWRPNGMVYVALSRCRSLGTLWVRGLQLDHIKVSSSASDYMRKLFLIRRRFPFRVIGLPEVSPENTQCGKRRRSMSDFEKENLDPNCGPESKRRRPLNGALINSIN